MVNVFAPDLFIPKGGCILRTPNVQWKKHQNGLEIMQLTSSKINSDVLLKFPLPPPHDINFIAGLNVKEKSLRLIQNGKPNGQRSEAIGHVLASLHQAGYPEKTIKYIFHHYPIGEKAREKGDSWLEGEIQRSKTLISGGRKATRIEINIDAIRKRANEILKSHEPTESFDFNSLPPIFADYLDWCCNISEAHPVMIMQSILATCSAFLGTKVYFVDYFTPLYANLWILTIAPSGSFKTTALNLGADIGLKKQASVNKHIERINREITRASKDEKISLLEEIKKIEAEGIILPSRSTAEGLLEHLGNGCGGMIMASEFGQLLESFEKNYMAEFKPLLTNFYDVPNDYLYKTRTKSPILIQKPFISINAVSTLPWVEKNICISDVSSGFFARFLLFYPPQKINTPKALPVKQKWHSSPKLALQMRLRDIAKGQNKAFTILDDAKELFKTIHDELYSSYENEDESTREILGPYIKRWSPYILKIAMIFEALRYSDSQEIGSESILASKCIVDYAIQSTVYLFKNQLGESPHRKKCAKVLNYIANKGGSVKRPILLSSRVLEGGKNDYDYIIETLAESDEIQIEQKDCKSNTMYHLKSKD